MSGLVEQANLAALQVVDDVVGKEERDSGVHEVIRVPRFIRDVHITGIDHRGGLELEEAGGSTRSGPGGEFEGQPSFNRPLVWSALDQVMKAWYLVGRGGGLLWVFCTVVVEPVSVIIPTPGLLSERFPLWSVM